MQFFCLFWTPYYLLQNTNAQFCVITRCVTSIRYALHLRLKVQDNYFILRPNNALFLDYSNCFFILCYPHAMQYYACVTAPGPQFFETRFHALGNIRNTYIERWLNGQIFKMGSQGSKRKISANVA